MMPDGYCFKKEKKEDVIFNNTCEIHVCYFLVLF